MDGPIARRRGCRRAATTRAIAACAQSDLGGERSPPPMLRPSAMMYWEALAPLMIADRLHDYRLARYCNLLARVAEIEELITRAGASGSTYPVVDDRGRARVIRELPQAAEYRHLLALLLVYEREIERSRVF